MQRVKFEQDKKKILMQLSSLGTYVLNNVSEAFDAIEHFDKEAIERIQKDELIINEMRDSILKRTLVFVTRHHPLAKDLRFIESASAVTREYERLGDLAIDIIEHLNEMDEDINEEIKAKVIKAANHAVGMVEQAIHSYDDNTKSGAKEVFPKEDKLNHKFEDLKELIISEMENCDKKKISDLAVYLYIIKYIERIGDHAKNISKAILFRKGTNY